MPPLDCMGHTTQSCFDRVSVFGTVYCGAVCLV